MKPRHCSRTGCQTTAAATLTYVYADSMAVVGPLALRAEPGTYDLCDEHTERVSTPRGWELIRLPLDERAGHDPDDLLALADAVRVVGFTWDAPAAGAVAAPVPRTGRRKGHLAVVVGGREDDRR